jgi:uncharacterized membrane protein
MAIFCTNCGAQNGDAAVFCSNCGKPIPPATTASSTAATGAVYAGSTATPVPPAPAVPGAITNENVMGGIAYLTFIPALIFLLIEPYKYNKFVRFHAWQEIWLSIARFVCWIALFWVPGFGFMMFGVRAIVGLVFFVAWLIAIINAFQGKMFKLPVLGDLAEQQANKM